MAWHISCITSSVGGVESMSYVLSIAAIIVIGLILELMRIYDRPRSE